jgi:beta-aspartyl-dipeptidase (metallo-type)
MFTLIKNCEVYSPGMEGRRDIFMAGGKIAALRPGINLPADFFDTEIIDACGMTAVPGFIDQHVHIAGGGGEGGPATRTPEIMLSDLTTAGVTTVVGLLGADGVTRSMPELLAKARALETEGLSAYVFTGAYQIPARTVTGSVRTDLVLIDKVIGTGEIALSDHRSAQPTLEMLVRLAAESRMGGMLGGKAGIVHLHLGEGKSGLNLVFKALENSDLPIGQFVPTHVNRRLALLEQAADFVKMGGSIDLTAGIELENASPDALNIMDSLRFLKRAGISPDRVTVSSDGNGSLPRFDVHGEMTGMSVGSVGVLWEDIKKAITAGVITIEEGIRLVTANVARVLKLFPAKGTLAAGSDADLVLLNRQLEIEKVFARGRLMVDNGVAVVKGTFE